MRKLTCPRGWQTSGVNQKFAWFKPEGKYQTPVYKVFVLQCIALPLSSGITFCSLQFFFLHGRITPSVQPDLKPVMADQRGDALSMCHDWCNPQKWHATKTMTHVTTTKNGDLIQYYLTSSPFWVTKCSSPQTKIEQYFQDPIVDDVFSIISRFSASSLRGC